MACCTFHKPAAAGGLSTKMAASSISTGVASVQLRTHRLHQLSISHRFVRSWRLRPCSNSNKPDANRKDPCRQMRSQDSKWCTSGKPTAEEPLLHALLPGARGEVWRDLAASVLMASVVLPAGRAEAAAGYSPEAGDSVLKDVAGAAYVLLVCVFFFRLLRKRAKTGTSQSFRTQRTPEEEAAAEAELVAKAEAAAKGATPLGAFWGAAQATGFCFLLFNLCGYIDGYFARQELPDQYTAQNITITLRTVVRGLAYLMTFIFGANAVGLTGLGVQLLLFPEKNEDQQSDAEGDAGQ